jgi:hypothetical protein
MHLKINSRRWIPLSTSAFCVVVVGVLLGWSILCLAGEQVQAGLGWSQPLMLYDGMVWSAGSTLVADRYGAAHLVWTLSDGQTYYYSRWDGTGWTIPIDILVATDDVELGPPVVVATTDGRLHLFWGQDYVMHSWAWSMDAANSARAWSAPEVVVVPNGLAQGRMDAKEDRFGVLHLVYAVRPGGVYYVHSEDAGLNWSEPAAVSKGTSDTIASAPRLDIGVDGRIHVVWDEWPSDGDPARLSEVHYAYSADGGEDWSNPQQLGEVADRGGNVLTREDGTVYLAWQAGTGSSRVGRFVQRSIDGGNTWEAPVNFSQLMGQSGYPCMALDSEGTLHIITGDGEYAFWEGRLISTPVDLRPLPEQTENARLTIVNGNQLLVVIGPFWSPGLYYTVKQLPLPAQPTATPLNPVAMILPTSAAAVEETLTNSAPITGTALWNTNASPADSSTSSTMPVLILSAGLSLALVVGVIIVRLWRRHG